jgi:secretion/DNA translocation related TadE-like protein
VQKASPLSSRAADEAGSASLIAAAMCAVLLAITVGGAQVGAAVVARHQAQAAADLAALAGAASVPAGKEQACARAAALAQAMRTVAVACAVDGLDLVVTVEAALALRLIGAGDARAVARAGPV